MRLVVIVINILFLISLSVFAQENNVKIKFVSSGKKFYLDDSDSNSSEIMICLFNSKKYDTLEKFKALVKKILPGVEKFTKKEMQAIFDYFFNQIYDEYKKEFDKKNLHLSVYSTDTGLSSEEQDSYLRFDGKLPWEDLDEKVELSLSNVYTIFDECFGFDENYVFKVPNAFPFPTFSVDLKMNSEGEFSFRMPSADSDWFATCDIDIDKGIFFEVDGKTRGSLYCLSFVVPSYYIKEGEKYNLVIDVPETTANLKWNIKNLSKMIKIEEKIEDRMTIHSIKLRKKIKVYENLNAEIYILIPIGFDGQMSFKNLPAIGDVEVLFHDFSYEYTSAEQVSRTEKHNIDLLTWLVDSENKELSCSFSPWLDHSVIVENKYKSYIVKKYTLKPGNNDFGELKIFQMRYPFRFRLKKVGEYTPESLKGKNIIVEKISAEFLRKDIGWKFTVKDNEEFVKMIKQNGYLPMVGEYELKISEGLFKIVDEESGEEERVKTKALTKMIEIKEPDDPYSRSDPLREYTPNHSEANTIPIELEASE